MKDQDSFKYNNALKITAAYTTDRSILFDFITSKEFNQHEISSVIKEKALNIKEIEVHAEEVVVDKNIALDESLKEKLKEAEAVLDPELFQPKASVAVEDIVNLEKEETEESLAPEAENALDLGKPLAFNKAETHSFHEWLQLTKISPIQRTEEAFSDSTGK